METWMEQYTCCGEHLECRVPGHVAEEPHVVAHTELQRKLLETGALVAISEGPIVGIRIAPAEPREGAQADVKALPVDEPPHADDREPLFRGNSRTSLRQLV